MTAEVLGRRALNRAPPERQMLLRRSPLSAPEAVERLVGMQAQAPGDPYLGLWTRLASFGADGLTGPIEGRLAARAALMRDTVRLVSARDCLRVMFNPIEEILDSLLLRGLTAPELIFPTGS